MLNLKHTLKLRTFFLSCKKSCLPQSSPNETFVSLINSSLLSFSSEKPAPHNSATQRFRNLLHVLDNKDTGSKSSFLYQKIIKEFQEIFKVSDLVIHNKENAMYLIKILIKLKMDTEKIDFIAQQGELQKYYEIAQETPDNYLLFSKTWEKVLTKANFALKDADLLFETIYQVPRTYSENTYMGVYTEKFLTESNKTYPPSVSLFFLSKMLVQTKKSSIIPKTLINSVLERYGEIKNNLFDLGMVMFVYYQCLSRYYVSIKKLNKWNIAQHISIPLEKKFCETEMIDISPALREGDEEHPLFYKLIVRDTLEYIERYENGEINISEKTFIHSLVFLFKSISRFSIEDKQLFEIVDRYGMKYKDHLNIVDKFTFLTTYAKYLNVIPSFAPCYEEEIAKALSLISQTLKFKQKTVLARTSLDTAFHNEEYYLHVKKQLNPEFKIEDLPAFFTNKDVPPFGLNQIMELFWYLGKTNTGQKSPELIKLSNTLLNLCCPLYTRYQMADAMQSASSLSEMTGDEFIDWKRDFEYKLGVFSEKCENWEPMKTQEMSLYSITSLYKNLEYIKAKHRIDYADYFSQEQIQYLKDEWFKSLRRYRTSKLERRIHDVLIKLFKNNNIKKNIQANKLIGVYQIDLFVEPNLILEINGDYHFPRTSSLELIKDAHFGNYLIKKSLYEQQGYDLIMLNYYEFEDIQYDEEKLGEYLMEKMKPYWTK